MSGYHSFLLRLWRETNKVSERRFGHPIWRASLKKPDSTELLVFANLEELVDYLYKLIEIPENKDTN
jgi:hypothetical protein